MAGTIFGRGSLSGQLAAPCSEFMSLEWEQLVVDTAPPAPPSGEARTEPTEPAAGEEPAAAPPAAATSASRSATSTEVDAIEPIKRPAGRPRKRPAKLLGLRMIRDIEFEGLAAVELTAGGARLVLLPALGKSSEDAW